MKRRKMKQSPLTPLILMAIIMIGFVVGEKGKNSQNQEVQSNGQNVQVDGEPANGDGSKQDAETSQAGDGSVDASENESKTYAEQALAKGTHIQGEVQDEYAKSVVTDYINRKVVESSSSNLVRYNEKNLYRQSFDEVTGYMALVKMTVEQDTTSQCKVTTELQDVTVVLVFPDQSYVVLETNENIECNLPKGVSTILYVGKKLSGSIEIEFSENAQVTTKRM